MKKVVVGNMPELPYAIEEAVNRLRVNISFLGKNVRKIMVISTVPDEGKSFVAMQLWHQMVISGSSSVLLDADMRKSVMADKYQIQDEVSQKGSSAKKENKLLGTSHYLAEDYPLEDVLYQTQWENGYVLPNTDNVVNPSMLLESERFSQMLDYMAEQSRYVFVDSPPLNLVSDGEQIGSLCDGAILVVRGGETPKSMVKNSVRQLERAGCPLLGIVLNRVPMSKSGRYGKKYGGNYYADEYYKK